jgi:RNA recognition motif-containing protein
VAQKLFVGNLPFTVDTNQLQDLFAQAGQIVSAEVKIDRMTNRSRGFGFVEMSSDEETQKAIEMFNGYSLEGRALVVNVARPMEDRPQRSFNDRPSFDRRGGGRGGDRGGRGGGRY